MGFEETHLSKVNEAMINAINKRMNGIDDELSETVKELSKTREEMASLKTEMRIWGGVIMAGILGMLGFMFAILRMFVEHMMSSGQLP